jgi:hypothetical protein
LSEFNGYRFHTQFSLSLHKSGGIGRKILSINFLTFARHLQVVRHLPASRPFNKLAVGYRVERKAVQIK